MKQYNFLQESVLNEFMTGIYRAFTIPKNKNLALKQIEMLQFRYQGSPGVLEKCRAAYESIAAASDEEYLEARYKSIVRGTIVDLATCFIPFYSLWQYIKTLKGKNILTVKIPKRRTAEL